MIVRKDANTEKRIQKKKKESCLYTERKNMLVNEEECARLI